MDVNQVQITGIDEQARQDVYAFLQAYEIIRRETGFGTLVIEIREQSIVEIGATHKIKPTVKRPKNTL